MADKPEAWLRQDRRGEEDSVTKRPRIETVATVAPTTPIAANQELYQMIVRQLQHDGYAMAAQSVAELTMTLVPNLHRDGAKLRRVVQQAKQLQVIGRVPHEISRRVEDVIEADGGYIGAAPLLASKFVEGFASSQRGVVKALAISPDGKYLVCGSTEGTLQMLSIPTIWSGQASGQHQATQGGASTAVVRDYADFDQSVEFLAFHPTQPLIFSGCRNTMINVTNYTKPNVMAATKQTAGHNVIAASTSSSTQQLVKDTFSIRCGCVHPSGSHIIYGTDHPHLRLLDVETKTILSCAGSVEHHTLSLTDVNTSLDGRRFVTSSMDGAIKVWDGVSGRCIHTTSAAHCGMSATTAAFSKSGNYILTAGQDNQVKMWDLRKHYTEAAAYGRPQRVYHRLRAKFSFAEDLIFVQGSDNTTVVAYDVHSMKPVGCLNHAAPQKVLLCSPTEQLVATGGEDFRVRVWLPSLHASS